MPAKDSRFRRPVLDQEHLAGSSSGLPVAAFRASYYLKRVSTEIGERMSIKPMIIPSRCRAAPGFQRAGRALRYAAAPIADDMLETMYDAPGIGLAAIQVGEPIRMLIIDLAEGR